MPLSWMRAGWLSPSYRALPDSRNLSAGRRRLRAGREHQELVRLAAGVPREGSGGLRHGAQLQPGGLRRVAQGGQVSGHWQRRHPGVLAGHAGVGAGAEQIPSEAFLSGQLVPGDAAPGAARNGRVIRRCRSQADLSAGDQVVNLRESGSQPDQADGLAPHVRDLGTRVPGQPEVGGGNGCTRWLAHDPVTGPPAGCPHSRMNMSVDEIIRKKRRWRVAAIALAYRLHDLELLSDWLYHTTCVNLSRMGYRSGEPDGIDRESSRLLSQVMADLLTTSGSFGGLRDSLSVEAHDINDLVFDLAPVLLEGDGCQSPPIRPDLTVIPGG